MKNNCFLACMTGFVLCVAACAFAAPSQKHLVGGYASASAVKKHVVEAAVFAVKAQEQALLKVTVSQHAEIQLVQIRGCRTICSKVHGKLAFS